MSFAEEFEQKKVQLLELIKLAKDEKTSFEVIAQRQKEEINELAKQKSQGFPWLAQAYADYFYLNDLMHADYLDYKSHPGKQSAEHIREVAGKRRVAEKLLRIYKYQLEYYETLFPWLTDFKEEDFDEMIKQITESKEESLEEEQIDPVKRYLTQGEYTKLSASECNQRALQRYWQKKKSKWEIGRDYERYIGFLYEMKGFTVYYQGIIEGFEDLGRDLVAIKDNNVEIVQCKYWSQQKTIHEKHIFQLFGTTVEYWIKNRDKKQNPELSLFPKMMQENKIKANLVTSAKLSEKALDFAKVLQIHVIENFPFKQYPCIKCNVSMRNGERIYHLPFDQQYDRTLIKEEKNECYVETVQEAEALGFRRAFRWHGAS